MASSWSVMHRPISKRMSFELFLSEIGQEWCTCFGRKLRPVQTNLCFKTEKDPQNTTKGFFCGSRMRCSVHKLWTKWLLPCPYILSAAHLALVPLNRIKDIHPVSYRTRTELTNLRWKLCGCFVLCQTAWDIRLPWWADMIRMKL